MLLLMLEMLIDLVVDLDFFLLALLALDLFLSIKSLRKGEIMTHLTKIHCLRYPFFLLILILSHIRIIIPFAWASWRAFCSASFAAFQLGSRTFSRHSSSQLVLQQVFLSNVRPIIISICIISICIISICIGIRRCVFSIERFIIQ